MMSVEQMVQARQQYLTRSHSLYMISFIERLLQRRFYAGDARAEALQWSYRAENTNFVLLGPDLKESPYLRSNKMELRLLSPSPKRVGSRYYDSPIISS